jgi:adenosylcobinamide-GDP ribazoletransferase
MKRLLAALRFLTVLPIPGTWGTSEDDLARSVPWFPVVGLLLSVVAGGAAWALSAAPPLLAAAVLVVLLLAFSGCLHVDGLADSADGLLSARPRDRVLEIMKDSRIGVMGATAIVCVLLLKFSALASLPGGQMWRAALLMPLAGRTAIVVHMALLPYVRPEGLGGVFYRRRTRWAAGWALAVLAAVAWNAAAWRGLTAWAVCAALAVAFSAYVYRRIGGATGDTFGAVCEIVELAPALTLAVWSLDDGR